MEDKLQMQIQERLDMAGIKFTPAEFEAWVAAADIVPNTIDGSPPRIGYRYCNKCKRTQKITLFNKNASAKDGCTSQCKECQKKNANKSYANNKHKRNYKKYYQEHKEEKRAQSRRYYQENKETLAKKHAAYRATSKGRKVMEKAHAKRGKLLAQNTGIPYTREMVIERDCQGGKEPICYLCGQPIPGTPHLDHVLPVVIGGLDCFTNIACTHDACNLKKSKDAREITAEQVEALQALSDKYIDSHQELFPEIFGESVSNTSADEA